MEFDHSLDGGETRRVNRDVLTLNEEADFVVLAQLRRPT